MTVGVEGAWKANVEEPQMTLRLWWVYFIKLEMIRDINEAEEGPRVKL